MDIFSDRPIELPDLIVDLVQVPLDQQLDIWVVYIGQVPVLCPVHAPIEVPARWQKLVKELFLKRRNLLIGHVFALLEQLGLGLLGAAELQQVLDNRHTGFIQVATVGKNDAICVGHSVPLVPHPTECDIVRRNDHLKILRIVLLIDDNATQSLKHDTSLGWILGRLTSLQHPLLRLHASPHEPFGLQIGLHSRLSFLLHFVLALLIVGHLAQFLLQSGLGLSFFFHVLGSFRQQELDVGEALGHVGLKFVLDFNQFEGILKGKDG